MMRVCAYLENSSSRLVGPNCPASLLLGFQSGNYAEHDTSARECRIVSRSGTLTYEIIDLLSKNGIGQSTSVGIGATRWSVPLRGHTKIIWRGRDDACGRTCWRDRRDSGRGRNRFHKTDEQARNRVCGRRLSASWKTMATQARSYREAAGLRLRNTGFEKAGIPVGKARRI